MPCVQSPVSCSKIAEAEAAVSSQSPVSFAVTIWGHWCTAPLNGWNTPGPWPVQGDQIMHDHHPSCLLACASFTTSLCDLTTKLHNQLISVQS